MNQLSTINTLGQWRLQANPNDIELIQVVNRVRANVSALENGTLYGNRYGNGKTLTQIVSETWLDNPKMTNEALKASSKHTINDIGKTLSPESREITIKRFPDYKQDPLQLFAASLKAIFIAQSPAEINQTTINVLEAAPSYGLTGPGERTPWFNQRYTIDDLIGIGTAIHDNNDANDSINRNKDELGASFVEQNSENKAVWGRSGSEISALIMFFEAVKNTPTQPVTPTGMIGSYLGSQITSYFIDDNFASQLLARSLGSTVTGWVGDTVEQFFIDKQSIGYLSIPNRFIGNLASNVVSLGTGELAENIIEALEIENTFAQMGVNTLTQALVDYAFTSVAVEYFPNFAAKYLSIKNVTEITSLSLIDSYINSLASYAGSEFYKTLVRWNIISESQLNQGSAIGGSLGALAIPGFAGWLGFTSLAGPIGIFVGTVVGSLIGGVFGDEDFPRAAYVINIVDGEFVAKFAYELDDGNTEIARQMGETAKEFLNFFAGNVGGQLLSVENVYYGHYKEQYVYQLQDDAPGGSSFRRRVGFNNAQAAIEAGVVYQLTKTQIEGGDRYIKRLFNSYTSSRSNLEDFNELLQIAKEYGTYQDNPALYQEYINKLAANSIPDADKRIADLQSHPWDSFVPAELNDELIKKVATNLLPTTITLSIEGDDLIVNDERIYGWVKTQPENKIQFLKFADGNLYTINVDKDNKVTLNLYKKDPTIRDFGLDILPSQVRLSLSGNNLSINGEIITNWLTNTNNRVEILRFADGSRFKIVVENNSTVKLESELVANWKTVLAKAIDFNLSTPQSSDNYKGNNITKILYGNSGVVQGNDISDDILISSSAAETLKGGKGDDVYRYSLGSGKDTIEDIGGVDVIEFDSNIQLSNLQLQQSSNNLIINIINPSNPSAPITNQLTIRSFLTNKIEFIRLGNNQEYFLDNSSGQWQLKATNSVQTSTSSNTTIQGTIGADALRGLGENDTLSGGAGNDTYLYTFGDGLNTTIYDTGDYEGKVRNGGIDTLVLDTNTIHSLKLQNKDLIITVSYVLPSFNSNTGNNEAQPITITIKNWVDENSRIEFIRLANGKDFYPTLAADGSVSLQPVLTKGESTLDVQLDVPDSYALSSYKLAIVDLFGNGLQLISAQDSFAMSDLDNDGYLEQTGWVSPSDGILVIDQNNDGRITEINEFISLTSQTNVTYIGSLNSNGDRLLNSQDTNFEKIRVWIDANGNHKVELGELAALHRYGIEDISLASQQKNFEIAGNLITASTYFTQLGYEFRKRSQIFDVAFAYNPNGVKLETLPGGINKFNFENKPDILIADDTAGNLNLTIDPTVTYSVTGGKGNDILTILAGSTTGGILNGGAGDDTLTGAGGSDIINGGKGKDVIKAGAGDDTITIDLDDILTSLDGGEGFDIVTLDADSRLHLILKDSNNIEAIIGTKISNQITYIGVKPILISGDLGNDIITGGEGEDQIEGGEGKDKLYGNKGKDLLLGGLDDDSLYGEQNDDQLYGQEGDDFLDGGDGNDILDGSIGNDSLKGGSGQNTYVFGRNYGIDTITQDNNADKDIISFKAGISPSDITFWRKSNNASQKDNLYLAIKNTHDRLIITDQLFNNTYGIDQFTFADGTIWTRENIQAWLLQSTPGDDYLLGYQSNDTLDGSAGNDLLNGGAGNNTYIFGRGYGIDTIAENSNTGTDTLSFKAGINPSDITFWRKPNSSSEKDNLYLAIKNTHDRIIIEDQFRSTSYGIDKFVFANGTIWTRENIQTWLLQSTTGDDYLLGYQSNDTLDGSTGNDLLNGDAGNNTYVFGRGYGIDTIVENYNTGTDTLSFKTGINPSDITFWRKPNSNSEKDNLYLAIKNTHDRIIIEDQFRNGPYGIDRFVFADGTIWTRENIQTRLLQSTTGDDYLLGYQSNDTLDGSAGNDLLNGDSGNNTYIFGRGYGVDTIVENYNTGTDTLSFRTGISKSDIVFWRKTNISSEIDNLYLAIKNTNDRLIIIDQFRSGPYGIDQFTFADGTTITRSDINSMSLPNNLPEDSLLTGDGNANTLESATGNDTLAGGTGNDTYIFKQGYGQDLIQEDYYGLNSYYDTVKFGTGLTTNTMEIVRQGNDLVFKVKGSSDRLTIKDQFDYPYEVISIEEFQFDNGATVWTKENIKQYLLKSTTGDDYLVGYSEGLNNETLDGNLGNDTLLGGTGNDTYIFKQGYGQDIIEESYYGLNSYYDTVKFGAGLTTNTMEIVRQGNDLIFKVKGSSDRLTIKDQFDYAYEVISIEEFQFDNGATVWTKENIKQYLLKSTTGDDYLVGYSEGLNNETLDGSLGNDTLLGGTGNDTYIFKQGYGQDIIEESYYGLNSYYDIVKFGAGLTTQTMEIVRQDNDLIFKVKGSSDRLTIKNQFDYPNDALSVEEFQFDNGAIIWTKEDIKQYLLKPTDGDDYIDGYFWGINNETLDGSLGNDTLVGKTGNDIYIFKLGYGQDLIQEDEYYYHSNYDIVKFGAGLTTNTMEIVRQDNDLVFKVKGSSDRLTIKNQFGYPDEAISVEEFQFDNGAVIWTKEDIKQYLLKSTDGDDYIVGYFWGINNENLDGGLGDDILAGSTGNDRYIFKHGYGQDIIQEDHYIYHTNDDIVKFGRGLTPQTMEIVRQDNDLIFKIKGTIDTLTIKGQFSIGEYNSVEEFQFDNGATIWTKEDIKNYLASTLNNAPTVKNAILDQTTGSNSPFNFTIPINTFSDPNIGDSLSYIATRGDGTSLPSWLKFNPITRTFTGTPALTDVGIINIKVIATDTSRATVSDILAINIRNLTGTTGNDSITGTLNDDKIEGNGGNDTLFGLAGNDTLDGGTGQDTMTGGLDNDTYIIDNSADKVVENSNEGTDTVRSSISYTLGENLENLILTGTSNLAGTGNALNNLITGNSSSNTLNGKTGDDTINGEGGDDTLKGELGNDTLYGGAGNDSLDGGTGNDVMIGGVGNDTYYTDNSNDQITEVVNEGTDTVSSAIDWTLGNNLENLILTGSNAINGTGNALNNNITGNSANNNLSGGDNNDTLNGGDGNDTLNGGNGNDSLIGGTGNDIIVGGAGSDSLTGSTGNDKFVFTTLGEGIDTITDFSSTDDVLVLQTLFTNLNYTGTNPITDGYIRSIQSGSNTLIQIDADGVGGSGNFSTLVTLSNFNSSNFSQNNLIF